MNEGCQCSVCREVRGLLKGAEGILARRLSVERREEHREHYAAILSTLRGILDADKEINHEG